MKNVKFLGAAGEVTGSSFLLTTDENQSVLIDLGMFQGSFDLEKLNFTPLNFDAKSLHSVLLTHAHLDHSGRLPLLIQAGFNGKIYTTAATKALTEISLLDSARIGEEDQDHAPLFTTDEVKKTLERIETVDYDTQIKIGDLTVTFRDAGHILGSASLEITEDQQTIVFSGDLGNSPEDLIMPTEYIDWADVVVMESTYGDKEHPQEDASKMLQQEINLVEESGGVLLIPAFSIERTQEVLHMIGQLKKSGQVKGETLVFLDSPMAIEVTEVFKTFPQICNKELQSEHDPFDFEGLKLTRTGEESKDILEVKGAKVIIAGSGMMSGGRILHHLLNYISYSHTRLLIVGYQAEGTLGRSILEGAKDIHVYDKNVQVRATITYLQSLSSHADQPKLMKWLGAMKGVKKVFLVHGEDPQRKALSEKIKSDLKIADVILPVLDQVAEIN